MWYLEAVEFEQVKQPVDLLRVSPDHRRWRPHDDLGYASRSDDALSLGNCAVDSTPRLHSFSVLYPANAVVEITADIIAKSLQDLDPPCVFPYRDIPV